MEQTMIKLQDWNMVIWIFDKRTKSGNRLFNQYVYRDKESSWMIEEVRELQSGLYPADKFQIDVTCKQI